ncbi:MAG: DNA mismatch repair protein MutS [Elusimicrobia bacterium]|nr:DNA mismatch repair protein MutS [Elusimicrobiota bacterium]
MAKETPLVSQYQKIKSQYPDTFLFFRLGDFYELFGDDAINASKIMEITLTKRRDMPMCGVPYHSAFTYIKKLIGKSKSVAICEQVEDPAEAKGIVKREVVRVITPGTVIEDDLLPADTNNFLSSVSVSRDEYGIVFLDISTGDFLGCRVKGMSALDTELSRFHVRELILPSGSESLRAFLKQKHPGITIAEKDGWYFSASKASDNIKEYFNVATLKGFELDKHPLIAAACGGLIEYLKDTQKERSLKLKNLKIYSLDENMIIDADAQDNLELVRNLRDRSRKNTLFEILDLTDTPMGKRRLAQYILSPLKDLSRIRGRLNGVEELSENTELSAGISNTLKGISDMERIVSRTNFGSCNARDLLGLKDSLKSVPAIKKLLGGATSGIMKDIGGALEALEDVADELERAITESPPLAVKEGKIIKKGYDSELDELIDISSGDRKWVSELESRERRRLGVPSLKVGYNKIHGYYIEVTKTHSEKVPEDYQRKQTLVNAERYITEELKKREDSILGAEEKKAALEYRIFCRLRDMVSVHASSILKNSELLSRLDVLNSFGAATRKYGYTKPNVNGGDEIHITDGRHPVVERSLGVNEFIPNDTCLDKKDNQILVITGPNMSGKSTYLKQTAIIVIMAQMGCFVPASEADIGVADRIFTRIGSGEDLSGGESTFMVEMTEVASILNNATPKSLLIMDEVGRGTSTFDGISIAWSVIEAISRIGGRTLFATHYFELTELGSYIPCVQNYNFAVREWKDRKKIVFLRKLQKGSADKSYGIHCAQLAGVPKDVIARAWEIFRKLESEELDYRGMPKAAPESSANPQMSLFTEIIDDKYKDMIRNMDLNAMSPIEVLNIVREWQKEIGS